jgi:hypothetical protein
MKPSKSIRTTTKTTKALIVLTLSMRLMNSIDLFKKPLIKQIKTPIRGVKIYLSNVLLSINRRKKLLNLEKERIKR